MRGDDILEEIARRIRERDEVGQVSDARLARQLGVTQTALSGYRGKELAARQIGNLMDSYAKANLTSIIESAVIPIVEFLPLD